MENIDICNGENVTLIDLPEDLEELLRAPEKIKLIYDKELDNFHLVSNGFKIPILKKMKEDALKK